MAPAVPPLPEYWTPRRVALATLVVLAVLLAFWLLYRFYEVVFILFVAMVLGTAIRPAVEWMARRGVPRGLGVVLVYLALLAVISGFILLVAPLLAMQVSVIVAKVPDYYRNLHESLLHSHSVLIYRLAVQLPEQLQLDLGGVGSSAPSLNGLPQVLGYGVLAAQVLFIGTSILVLALYWILDGERTVRALLLRFPVDRRETLRQLFDEMETRVGAYMRGVVVLNVALAIMATIAYVIVGLPSALALGILAGLMEVVPVIGPILGAIPPILLALAIDPGKVVWVLLAVIIIQQIEGNLLVPRVMDKAVGVNAIVTILAISAFGALFGLPGALMAIPLAAIVQVLINHLVIGPPAMELEQPQGRDRISILRYQTQALVQDVRKEVRHKDGASDGDTDRLEDLIEAAAMDLDSLLAQAAPGEEAA